MRIPYGDNGLTKIPDSVSDEDALFTGDLLSTGLLAARIGEISKGRHCGGDRGRTCGTLYHDVRQTL